MAECLRAASWVFDVAREHEAKWVIHGGDVFEDRRTLDIMAYQSVYDIIVDGAKDGISTCILLGNHDMFHLDRWDTSSIKPLEKAATVVMHPQSLDICGHKWDFMPYTDKPAEMLERYFPIDTRGDYMVGHFGVSGAIMNGLYGRRFTSRAEAAELHKEMFHGWRRAFLGHFHKRQMLECENAEFVGSPLQLNFGEAGDEKAVAVLNLDTAEVDYVFNDFSPRFIIADSAEQVLSMPSVKGCHVRIDLKDKVEDVMSVRRRIEKEAGPASCTVRPPKIQRNRPTANDDVTESSDVVVSKSGLDPFVIANDHEEMVRRYAEACAMPPDTLDLGLEIIRSVRGTK